MKKVILTGFSLMAFAAASFAQNNASYSGVGTGQTSTQNQTGNNLTSTVIQGTTADGVGANIGNTSLTEQKSRNNTATVTQTTAQYDQALIYQNTVNGPASGAASNQATIQQIGSGSTALLPGDPGVTPGAPSNGVYGNIARIGQEKYDNKALIQQNGNGSANYSNYARIDQAGAGNGYNTLPNPPAPTRISQNGLSQGNVASIDESSFNNYNTFIDQSNNSIQNTATINQVGGGGGDQASITQDNNSSLNKGTITQQGVLGQDKAAIFQNGSGSNASSGNTGTITQDSQYNVSNIYQNAGAGAGGSSTGNTASISQLGYGNITPDASGPYGVDTYVSQSNNSHDNTATVNQPGSLNIAHVNQDDNSHNNTAEVNQSAANTTEDNTRSLATINQSANSFENGATINQTGYKSETGTINQTGNSHNNIGLIQQGGVGDVATINQTPVTANNKATINQGGNGTMSTTNKATVTQSYAYDPTNGSAPAGTGAGNTVAVNQNQNTVGGSNVATVLQGGEMNNITSTSKITVDQDDSFNGAYLTQTGQGLTATVKQTGNYNLLKNVGPTDPALQLGSGYELKVTQSVDSGFMGASATVRNTASVNSNNVGGGGVTINQTLTNN